MIEIRHINGKVLYTATNATDIKTALEEAVKSDANLAGANLARANLAGAYLADANLAGAYLAGAYLADANLAGAYLAGANLADAYLADANLAGANLAGAYLARANLARANLAGAYLADANLAGAYLARANLAGAKSLKSCRLETGETFDEYLRDVVPALLKAGGRELAAVLTPEHWACHNWDNCPMAAAFGVKSQDETPLLLRPRVEQFVRLFDQGLIPMECVGLGAKDDEGALPKGGGA